ncbi:hypothetical protein ACFPM0_28170 [Pseudonocardia sulfidoxydans]|uniref:hypothetical protein n=1 Tax=Pseudonocardia sulfidoxydans TaxID=54011 RepID=UPI003607D763
MLARRAAATVGRWREVRGWSRGPVRRLDGELFAPHPRWWSVPQRVTARTGAGTAPSP